MNPCSDENPHTYRIGEYSFRKLIRQDEIRRAEKLLHEVYIIEQDWSIKKGNPSELEVKTCNNYNYKYLTDGHSDYAHWFGAFYKRELIGCFRLLDYSNNELENYVKLPEWLKNSSPCELNRLAISAEHRNKKFIFLMLKRISL